MALDHRCEVFAVPKWVGIGTKEVRNKLTDQAALPSVEDAKKQIAKTMTHHLAKLREEQESAIHTRLSEIERKRVRMVKNQAAEREALQKAQWQRQQSETLARQARYRKGLKGLLDRVTGRHRQTRKQNEREAYLAEQRDRKERDAQIFSQLDQRRGLQARINRLKNFGENRAQVLSCDIDQYHDIENRKREKAAFIQNEHPGGSRYRER